MFTISICCSISDAMSIRYGSGWLQRPGWPSLIIVSGWVFGALAWLAFAPVKATSSDQLFEIPQGTWARRMAGDKVEILPAEIRLTLGVRDVLLLKNSDTVPQQFGPTLIMPGQSFRLPFERAASYQFACSAHASGQMSIIVEPRPDAPWARLRWRMGALLRSGVWQ
jgi:hypothetical protein